VSEIIRTSLDQLVWYIQHCPALWWLAVSEPVGGLRRRVTDRSLLLKIIPIFGVPLLTAGAGVLGVYLSIHDSITHLEDAMRAHAAVEERAAREHEDMRREIEATNQRLYDHIRDHGNGHGKR
jgi:hypothetical protein